MNDRDIERAITDSMPVLDVPQSLSGKNVLLRIENVSQIKSVSVYKKYISIAAALLIVCIGMLSYISIFGRDKNMYMNEMPYTEEAVADIETNSSDEEAYIYNEPAEPEEAFDFDEKAAAYDSSINFYELETVVLSAGEETEYEISSSFGNNPEICYYILDEELTDDENNALILSYIIKDDKKYLKINAVKSGSFIVSVDEIYSLKVVVTEG